MNKILVTQNIYVLLEHHIYYSTVETMYAYKLRESNKYYWICTHEINQDIKLLNCFEYDIIDKYHSVPTFGQIRILENNKFYE